jgi:transcriptional antiterminator RfaH
MRTPWFAANTHPHRETTACEHLRRQGFDTYCPVIRRRVRHARKTIDALRPLFPGYVFLQPRRQQSLRPVASTLGIRALVCQGEVPCPVPRDLIEGLRAREVDGVIMRGSEEFRPGQTVVMAGGPFDGVIAEVIALGDKDRLLVLMNILNQAVKVSVGTLSIRAAS